MQNLQQKVVSPKCVHFAYTYIVASKRVGYKRGNTAKVGCAYLLVFFSSKKLDSILSEDVFSCVYIVCFHANLLPLSTSLCRLNKYVKTKFVD